MGESNTTVSGYTLYLHLQQYRTHQSIYEPLSEKKELNASTKSVDQCQSGSPRRLTWPEFFCRLILYHRIPNFNDPEKEAFRKHSGKRRKCW